MCLNLGRMTKRVVVIYSEIVVIGVILILIKLVQLTNINWKLLQKLKTTLSFAKSSSLFIVRYSIFFRMNMVIMQNICKWDKNISRI